MAVADILVSPARVWYAPVGEANPNVTTIKYGQAWGGNWVDLGYTLEKVSLSYEKEVFKLMVEQTPSALKGVVTAENVKIETILAEMTGANMNLALKGTLTTTAAGASQRGFSSVKAGGDVDLQYYKWGFEGLRVDTVNNKLPVRFFFYSGSATLNGSLAFAKNSGVGIPLAVDIWADIAQAAGQQICEIQIVTAKATGETPGGI